MPATGAEAAGHAEPRDEVSGLAELSYRVVKRVSRFFASEPQLPAVEEEEPPTESLVAQDEALADADHRTFIHGAQAAGSIAEVDRRTFVQAPSLNDNLHV